MNKPRRHFLGTEKVAILKRHLIDKVPVSDLCDELDIYPNQLYGWLKEFFENGHAAFDNGRKSKAVEDANHHKIATRRYWELEQSPPAVRVLVKVDAARMDRWQDAASRAQCELVEWMTEILDRAAVTV